MSSDVLNILLTAVALLAAGLLGMILVGANIYDVREARKSREFELRPQAARYRPRPLVSVVVVAQDDVETLEATVLSLVKSSYRKLEIIIALSASSKGVKSVAKSLMAAHPKRSIKVFTDRARHSGSDLAARAYRSRGRGKLVLTIKTGRAVDKRAIMRAVRHFNADRKLEVMQFNQRVDSSLSSLGLLQKYEYLLRFRAKKFFSLLQTDYLISGEDVALYRKDAFLAHAKAGLASAAKTIFASDAVVFAPPADSLDTLVMRRFELQAERFRAWRRQRELLFAVHGQQPRTLTWLRLPFATLSGAAALIAPLLFGYFVYVAIRLHQPVFFVLCLLALTIVLLLTIWGDEHLRWGEKIAYSVGIPLTYGLFCVYGLLQPIVVATEIALKGHNKRAGLRS